MSKELHARAEQLIAQERIEGISAADQQWLRLHLCECAACTQYASSITQTLRAMRGISIEVPSTLVSRAKFRVRLRAQQLRTEPRWKMIWFASAISWIFGAVTAPYIWHGLEWVGHRTGIPNIIWELGFGLWWALPAVAVGLVLLMDNTGRSRESVWNRQEN
jgi:predicted anti-sigma-YlaC factor YlaD